jgi:uncharacterized membrane protein (UPF0127 family)
MAHRSVPDKRQEDTRPDDARPGGPLAFRLGRRRLLAVAAGLILALEGARALAADPVPASPEPAAGEVHVETVRGTFRFAVELADTADERARGLMFRRELPRDSGMLFDFGRPQPVFMWMKNTFLPLDMIFLDPTGTVVFIALDTRPHDRTPIGSDRPVRAVLEVNAGTAQRIGLAEGDRVGHPIFIGR